MDRIDTPPGRLSMFPPRPACCSKAVIVRPLFTDDAADARAATIAAGAKGERQLPWRN
jgi:hypothetical protein